MLSPSLMKFPVRLLLSFVGLASVVTGTTSAAEARAARKKVLYFSKMSVAPQSHTAALRKDGQPSPSENVLTELGAKNNIEFVFSKDGSLFSADYLGQFDAIIFY